MKKSAKVTLYGTHICPWCELARVFLEHHHIPFEDIYVDSDKKAAALMLKKTGQRHVPVIEVGKKIILGFDEDELRKVLRVR